MFVAGLFIGLVLGGVAVAFYLNNIHSSKVQELEDKIKSLTASVTSAIKN